MAVLRYLVTGYLLLVLFAISNIKGSFKTKVDFSDESLTFSHPMAAMHTLNEEGDTESIGNTSNVAISVGSDVGSISIREWGCNRHEAPFIFVHIGKAGGGGVRARIAASALDYSTRDHWKGIARDTDHYYPIQGQRRGKLCNSLVRHHRVPESTYIPQSFEGRSPCNATTPMGMAVACPQTKTNRGTMTCMGCSDLNSTECHTVYVGHNHIGSEIHWLPPRILKNWWKSEWGSSSSISFEVIDYSLSTLLPGNKKWCPRYNKPRPKNMGEKARWFMNCSVPLSKRLDTHFNKFWKEEQRRRLPHLPPRTQPNNGKNFGPLYASLPVQRVTMLREPFSWLLSKFSWHKKGKEAKCDDLETAASGWAFDFSVNYMLYICGVDCINRFDHGIITIEEIEAQAAFNLRNSFSVVGLLNETDGFYDMISKRVAYINTSLNHPHVDINMEGVKHASTKTKETKRCAKKFQDEKFRRAFRKAVPALAAAERLFELGVMVNRFQKRELEQCKA
jgi:hypothetical protein